jgi:SAM-dependent methyltransferase
MVETPITGNSRDETLTKTVSVFVQKLLPLSNWTGERLLDLGCGDGTFTIHFSKNYREIHGIDIQQKNLDAFARKTSGDPRLHLHNMSSSSMDFPDNHFDTIMTLETLEHVADLPGTAREIHRVLKPSGELLITVPNRWFPCENHGADIGPISINRAPLLTYLPPLHRRFARARVFKASDLDHLFHPLGLQRTATDYIWPTFEHGGNFLQPILKPLFGTMRKMENAPMPLKMFGASLVSRYLNPLCKS